MIRLMGEGEAVAMEAVLDSLQRQAPQIEVKGAEQVDGGNAVLDRHAITALQHHRLTAGQQRQCGEWIDRCCAGASVERHPEAQGCRLPVLTRDHRAQ